ncbi:MAG: zinc-binding dehydrogenase [Chloroflexota bacterium]
MMTKPANMKAWRLHGFGDHRLEEMPVPETRPGWVLLKVRVVQFAVTEAGLIAGMGHLYRERIGKMLAEGRPVQLGHEFCAEVVEIGEGVTKLQVGDRVSQPGSFRCGTCAGCRTNRDCLSPMTIPFDALGAFAEYTTMPERALVKIPEGPTDNEAAALQPLGVCVNFVKNAQINMGDTVVVLGQGAMGLGCLQIARLAGAGQLIGVDRRPESLQLALDFGATAVVNAAETDPVEEVRRLTGGVGADVVFELAGGRVSSGLAGLETLQQAILMLRRGGQIIEGANLEGTIDLDAVQMRNRCIRYIFPTFAHAQDVDLAYAAFLVATGRVKVGPQISHVVHSLEKLPEAAGITENKAKYRATNPAQIVV